MAAVLKGIKTIRNNWKKSIFFTAAAIYAGKWVKGKYEDSLIRTAYCKEAKAYGEQPIYTGQKPQKVTVFLNPSVQNGKGKSLFEKDVAPLLYLAGLEVTVIKTEYEGQAKRYMDVLDGANTDAIIVVGGDGTLLEVVTGLYRRKDKDVMTKIPIGVVPLGQTNTLASTLFEKSDSLVKWRAEAVMSVVKNQKKPVDVMAITAEEGKAVYALNSLQWGAFMEAEQRKPKYWYLGRLKNTYTYMKSTRKEWPPVVKGELTYSQPCQGCSSCYIPPPPVIWKWWHIFLPPRIEVPPIDYSKIENEDCGKERTKPLETVEFVASTGNTNSQVRGSIQIKTGPSAMIKQDFLKEGVQRSKKVKQNTGYIMDEINAGKFTLTPELKEGSESWFIIDNEPHEAMPISVELLKDGLHVFCPPNRQEV